MTTPDEPLLHKLQFYLTTAYPCSYLPGNFAQSLMAAPQHLVNAHVYSNLIQQGFRRSGDYAYRPHCPHCQSCVSVRVVLQDFKPSRSQKRAYKQHQNLTARILTTTFDETHFALYSAYIKARHAETEPVDSEKSQQTEIEQYRSFVCQSHVDSVMVEFSENEQVKMVSLIDVVDDGISAVYTFFDPSDKKSSYGIYNIMWQIAWAKSLKLNYVYLGYWIKNSQKMAYKQQFLPQQRLINQTWETVAK
jgi:arginine-tRNA-protein transferase